NTPQRFESYGWNVLTDVDGHDIAALDAAVVKAKALAQQGNGPTLICCRTVIGKGAPNAAGSEKVHGAPLGTEEITATRAALNWPHEPFSVPADVYARCDCKEKGQQQQAEWQTRFDAYAQAYPAQAAELLRRLKGDLPADFPGQARQFIEATNQKAETLATRKASQLASTALL